MSSCKMNNQDSDEEVDLEALRLAALKSRKAKFSPRINHNNLIPIVPVPIVPTAFDETKIKKETLSPPPEGSTIGSKLNDGNKENEEDKVSESNYSESTLDNDQDILSVEDKEEEDSLERLMDQLEAEISGKVPVDTKKRVLIPKYNRKDRRKKKEKVKVDDEVELIQVKEGKEPGAVIKVRESVSPVNKNAGLKSESFSQGKSPLRRSRSPFRSRSRSPFFGSRGYGRSRSPYWSRSPRRSRSPYRRSRSPYWLSRRSRSLSRKSRSPFGRYRSPFRKRSPYSRFSKSRSKSFDRRRSPWSSPRRRSKSPFYREWSPCLRRRNYSSPTGRGRRSFSPRGGSKSPRGRSRTPRRFPRNSPLRRSKSPFIRSKSPLKRNKSPPRRPLSPYLRRSNSPGKRILRRSRSPPRWSTSPGRRPKSPNRLSPRIRSKSPPKKSDQFRKSPRRRSLSFSPSPTSRRNRSPLKVVEKNKLDINEKDEKLRDRSRGDKRQGSLSRENNRRTFRQRSFRRFSPLRNRKSAERQVKRSKSPKQNSERKGEESSNQNAKSAKTSPTPLDPVLEARKKKFEVLSEVDPTVDKKISLKSIKESTENVEEDEDALTINLEGNLWHESEESGDEFESRFKSSEAGKSRTVVTNRTVLSFRSLREADSANRQDLINKPLIEENRREKGGRRDRSDRWQGRKGGRNESRKPSHLNARKEKADDMDKGKPQSSDKSESGVRSERRSERKPIVWLKRDDSKPNKNSKETEVSKVDKNKTVDKRSGGSKDRLAKEDAEVNETDDFDKLISDFEKELESDICLLPKDMSPPPPPEKIESKRPKISIKQDLLETKANNEVAVKKPTPARVVKISEATSISTDFDLGETNKVVRNIEKMDLKEPQQDGPEDYIEDDDFALDVSSKPPKNKMEEEEDNQSDLRAVLSRRRNQRITKVVNLQENVPTRLLQSAFQGLGNKKSRRQEREVQEPVDSAFDKGIRNTGVERRRVLLLQRDNTPIATSKIVVPEVKPDTTVYQRFPPTNERRKRKLRRQQDPIEDLMMMDQEDDDDGGFEIEEGKQSRRFRLKRNVTLSSQSRQRHTAIHQSVLMRKA